ncbi:LamG-like jellyroll fold domain-containing protein [Undibacterium sp. Ji50W]|uniref:LamG-like jellyroll fold domain-containing protein n=1 Tax=Undibacterium sp. Ji50W TaxID=3413041 RepID=UPI003BF0FD2F
MNKLLDALGAEILATTWTCPSVYGPLTSPLLAAGDKLIGVVGKVVYAVDIHNGKQVPVSAASDSRWVYEMRQPTGTDPRVTACDGAVYLMDGDYLTALSLANGAKLTNWTSPKLGRTSSLVADKGIVMAMYLDSKKGASRVAGYFAATGAKAFEPVEVAKGSAGPACYGSEAVFFVAAGKLLGVNLRSGDTRWTYTHAQDKLSAVIAPCAAEKVVLVAGRDLHGICIEKGTELYKISPGEEGNVNWNTPVIDIPAKVRTASKVVNLKAARPPQEGTGQLLQTSETDPANLAAGVAIATNSIGDLICFALADGKIKWRSKVKDPSGPRIIDGVVYVKIDGGKQLARFYVENGRAAGMAYSLPNLASAQPAVITNGTLFLADDLGGIAARPYANQTAAYFDGLQSRINIRPDGTQFDFGERNFTVEAWVRSSQGGDIISAYPTTDDPNANGFRLNLTPNGQIRVAIFSADGKRQSAGRSNASSAADGNWHHIALVRRNDTYLIILDGVPQEVRLPETPGAARLAIGGNTALTIGALVSKKGNEAESFFNGLIREVRLWNCAMEASLIESNRSTALKGTEPQLLGLWRLDEVQATDKAAIEPYNAAAQHRVKSQFITHASRRTDLSMDRNAFPYLLRESSKQWPYANTWGARGQTQVTGSSALSSNGILAFPTENVLYAVGTQDGKRKWAMDIAEKISDPIADGASFLLLTQDDSLVRIDARSGQKTQLAAFAGLHNEHAEALPAPAVNETYVAAATGAGNTHVVIAERQADTGLSIKLPGTPLQLAFCKTATNSGLTVLTRIHNELRLHLIDCVTGLETGKHSVTSEAYCIAGSWVFAMFDDTVVKLDTANLAAAPLATSSRVNSKINGMVASLAEDLLVLATADGKALAYSLSTLTVRWDITLPDQPSGTSNAVNTPVLDRAARVICTTASGTIAAINGKTGKLIGLYKAQNGTVGTPQVYAGTVYTGCHDTLTSAKDAELDGAMHSVVLGDISALRLNLDRQGNPVANGTQHAVIDISTKDATLHLMRVQESCVEAWVNVPRLTGEAAARAGGGIVGIAATEESDFDINMWLDADGTLHYSSSAKENDKWTGIHVKAQTTIMDGRWHHFAASRRPAAANETTDQVILYVDGKAVPTVHLAEPSAPKVAPAGLKAYVGANVAADLRAEKSFCGMIAEVRIWDTYLVAPEIASRMLVKLRGDEPALLAYWNFDYQSVHDSALQGHSGILAQEPCIECPAWWLTDLPFTQPSYPHITSTASIARMQGNQPVYALTAKVCAADGAGMAGKRVEMWYIKRRPDDPSSIFINGTEVLGVKSGTEPDPVLRASNIARVFSAVTGSDGTLNLSISSPEAGHGPSLDLWTSFMPVNERFHVNVLINNQVLAKPVPPTLTAQAKLIQDYNYTTGDKISDKKDRSTWRVVLRSRESDGGLCMREPITLWASKPTTIEVAGKKYQVNTERSVTVDSEANGDMTIVMEAEDLTAPSLYARAGFMNRNERIIISPDQDAQVKLSTMQSDDMTKPRVTNWKKEGGGEETLLNEEHKEHAGDISRAVRQVSSAASTDNNNQTMLKARRSPAQLKLMSMRAAEKGIEPGLLKAGDGHASNPDLLLIDSMQQEDAGADTDRVTLLRTVAGTPRQAPANPDAFRRSMGGAMGFVIEAGGPNGYSYRTLHTQEAMTLSQGAATPVSVHAPHMLGGFFDDMWSGIKDAAVNVYESAKSIAVIVADTVRIAITKVVNGIVNVVNKVVATVEDALNAIAGFFEQLVVAIKKLIAFLRALFDWGAILDAQRILLDIFRISNEVQKKTLKDKAGMTRIARMIAGLPETSIPAGKSSLNSNARDAGGKDSPAIKGSDGVQANSMLQKSNSGQVSPLPGAELSGTVAPAADAGNPFLGVIKALPGIAGSLLDLSPGDLVKQLKNAMTNGTDMGLEALVGRLADMTGNIADGVDALVKLLDAPIYIPFVSELYKWITGLDLSILSLLCLALGVFFNTLYAFVTLIEGDARSFAGDAKGLPAKMRAAAGLPPRASLTADADEHHPASAPMLTADNVPGTPRVWEILFIGARSLVVIANTVSDAVHFDVVKNTGIRSPAHNAILASVGLLQGLCGMIAAAAFTFGSQPAMYARLNATLGDDRSLAKRYEWVVYLSFGLTSALGLVKFVLSAIRVWKKGVDTPPVPYTFFGELEIVYKTNEFAMMCGAGVISAGLMSYMLLELYSPSTESELARIKNDNVRNEYKLLVFRDAISLSPLLFEFMYTDDGIKHMRSMMGSGAATVYGITSVVRAAGNIASVALHGVAVFKYGDME